MGRCVDGKMLGQYMDGELSPVAAERVRAHVAGCAVCAAALQKLRAAEEALRQSPPRRAGVPTGWTPDLAKRVTANLQRRGAFLAARISAGKRRLVGDRVPLGRAVAVVSLAASILVLAFVGFEALSRNEWARRTAPVVADAERVLVRLVRVDPAEQEEALARARREAENLALPERLADTRAGADTNLVSDLGRLQRAFALLADERDLPPELVAQLHRGDLLERTERLRESLALAR
ncbi:MAG TPA: zf-HC2 domain-containing protein [Phycisphaerae bacterium]|nr:zf-HC2 domain-containing protein [Phycisphaerae bacterium]